jgi:hypothetical protein
MKTKTKLQHLAQDVFDVITCYGEESQCWFDMCLADVCGIDRHLFEDALFYLQAHNKLHVRFEANGDVYARVVTS